MRGIIATHGTLYLGMASVTDQHALPARGTERGHFNVDLGHQRASSIKHLKAPALCFFLNRPRHPVGAKDYDGIIRHLRQFIDEDRSAGPKIVDDVTVVHHLMAHINRAAKDFEGAIHYVDRPVYTGTKPSWVGEYNVHQCNSAGSTCAMRTLK